MKPTTAADLNLQVRERLKTLPLNEAHTVGRTASSRASFIAQITAQTEKLAAQQSATTQGEKS